jgi:hypothetical protein
MIISAREKRELNALPSLEMLNSTKVLWNEHAQKYLKLIEEVDRVGFKILSPFDQNISPDRLNIVRGNQISCWDTGDIVSNCVFEAEISVGFDDGVVSFHGHFSC